MKFIKIFFRKVFISIGLSDLMSVTIRSQGKKMITTGSFITLEKENNEVAFKHRGHILNFEMSFIQDKNRSQDIDYHPNKEDNKMLLKFYNFDNSLGTGTNTPIKLTDNPSKNIYLQTIIYALDKNIKNVTYTFYEGS